MTGVIRTIELEFNDVGLEDEEFMSNYDHFAIIEDDEDEIDVDFDDEDDDDEFEDDFDDDLDEDELDEDFVDDLDDDLDDELEDDDLVDDDFLDDDEIL